MGNSCSKGLLTLDWCGGGGGGDGGRSPDCGGHAGVGHHSGGHLSLLRRPGSAGGADNVLLSDPLVPAGGAAERSGGGFHMSLAKMDSAPSSSVVGVVHPNGATAAAANSHYFRNLQASSASAGMNIRNHLIAHSEASLLNKIHGATTTSPFGGPTSKSNGGDHLHQTHLSLMSSIITSAPRKSFVCRIPPVLVRSGSHEASSKHHHQGQGAFEAKVEKLFEKYRDIDAVASGSLAPAASNCQLESDLLQQPSSSSADGPSSSSAGAADHQHHHRNNNNNNNNNAIGSNPAEDDVILALGTEALCEDLEMQPDDFRILVLAWKCNAEQMCRFTRAQFAQGCRALGAENVAALQARLGEAASEVSSSPDLFKDLYRFTFKFGLNSCGGNNNNNNVYSGIQSRNMPNDMAVILWQLVFSPREPPILARWLNFVQYHNPVRGISCDTWNIFLNFADSIGDDLSAYDGNDAWPSLFDDFVEFETDQANQNVDSSHKSACHIHESSCPADEATASTTNSATASGGNPAFSTQGATGQQQQQKLANVSPNILTNPMETILDPEVEGHRKSLTLRESPGSNLGGTTKMLACKQHQ